MTSMCSELPRRVDSIDFWRGLVLCMIFINHIPGNVFEILTQKNIGFSDSSEAFVFLSGVSLATAYAPRLLDRGVFTVVLSLARRAVRLYGVHVLLSLAAIAIFSTGALLTGSGTLLEVHGRDLFVDDPQAALVGLMSLGHQLGYFNILPMYIVLLAFVAPLLWIGCTRPRLMIAASLTIYLASRAWGWNIPTWPMKGSWFFDPFAWQFMMVIGLYVGLTARQTALPRHPMALTLAVAIVAGGALCVTNGLSLVPGLEDWTRSWADLDKTDLGLGRLVHFMAVAYLLQWSGITEGLRPLPPFKALCRLGRHSLWIFALLSLMAAVGQVVTDSVGHTVPLDVLMIGGGLACLFGAARLLEWRRPLVVRRKPA